jgi:hypothetical protein
MDAWIEWPKTLELSMGSGRIGVVYTTFEASDFRVQFSVTSPDTIDPPPSWTWTPSSDWLLNETGSVSVAYLFIPLYIPLLLIALPTTFLWLRDRRSKSPVCPACDYDLSGIQTGSPCPECGTLRSDSSSPLRAQ